MTYQILFIDEEKSAHGKFKRNFLDNNKERFTGLSVFPKPSLEEMLEEISAINPDAVLTDYSLNEYKADLESAYEVTYDGGELANEIHARHQGFPVFITTSLGDDAARGGADVKIIYEKYGSFNDGQEGKEASSDDRQHLTFADKLYHEINTYNRHLENCSDEFDALLEKRTSNETGLSLEEEERLIYLDGILEELIDGRSRMPKELKTTSNAEKLAELLALAKEIVGDKQS